MAHDVSGEVRKIIAEQLSIPVDKLGDEVTLDSLGADSLDRVEIVMNLEDHFSIHIDDTSAEKLSTVGQVVSYIQSLVKS